MGLVLPCIMLLYIIVTNSEDYEIYIVKCNYYNLVRSKKKVLRTP